MVSSPSSPLPFDPRNLYILYYRHGVNPALVKFFEFEGSLPEAMERAKIYCERMNFGFNFVRPFLSDLTKEENRKTRSFGEPIAS